MRYCTSRGKKGNCQGWGYRTQTDTLFDSISECSEGQIKAHCTQIQSSSQKSLIKWTLKSLNYINVTDKGLLCIKRGGISSKNRPILQNDNICGANYKKCGTICSPDTDECPIS